MGEEVPWCEIPRLGEILSHAEKLELILAHETAVVGKR